MNDLPPLPDAICRHRLRIGGHRHDLALDFDRCRCGVPNAIESIGTPACFAAAVASATVCSGDSPFAPIVGEPSLINTMAAAAVLPPRGAGLRRDRGERLIDRVAGRGAAAHLETVDRREHDP